MRLGPTMAAGDLARKAGFLHDNSAPDLETLLNPTRGATQPHPFYVSPEQERRDLIAFLTSRTAKVGDETG